MPTGLTMGISDELGFDTSTCQVVVRPGIPDPPETTLLPTVGRTVGRMAVTQLVAVLGVKAAEPL